MTSSCILSERELEVLKLVALGNSNKEVARILYIAEHTVEKHLNTFIKKFKSQIELLLVVGIGNAKPNEVITEIRY